MRIKSVCGDKGLGYFMSQGWRYDWKINSSIDRFIGCS